MTWYQHFWKVSVHWLLHYIQIVPFPLYHLIHPGNYLSISVSFLNNDKLMPNLSHRLIEASVVLLPLFDFLHLNTIFTWAFLDATLNVNERAYNNWIPPLPCTVLSLSSYILTHASSSSSRQAMLYANLTMDLLLVMSENARTMETFCEPLTQVIRLCWQVGPLTISQLSNVQHYIITLCTHHSLTTAWNNMLQGYKWSVVKWTCKNVLCNTSLGYTTVPKLCTQWHHLNDKILPWDFL